MPTARLNQATLETIHDLQVQVEELTTRTASLQASLDATTGELTRSEEARDKAIRERDYFKSFGVSIATRLHVLREGVQAIERAAELAGYTPAAVKNYREANTMEVEEALSGLAKRLGANGATREEVEAQ